MSTPLGAMLIELELDSSKFASNLNASKKAVNYFKAEARALDAAMKSSGNTMTLLGAKQKTLTQALDKLGNIFVRILDNIFLAKVNLIFSILMLFHLNCMSEVLSNCLSIWHDIIKTRGF